MLVDEKRVHPEVKQVAIRHIARPSHPHDVQLDSLSEGNLDVADYQQRVLQLRLQPRGLTGRHPGGARHQHQLSVQTGGGQFCPLQGGRQSLVTAANI